MAKNETRQPVLQYYEEVLNRRQPSALPPLLAPGFKSHFGDYTVDSAGYAAAVGRTLAAFADLRVEVLAQVAEGELVATRWRASGTIAGQHHTISAMHFHRVVNGQLAEHWEELDTRKLPQPPQ